LLRIGLTGGIGSGKSTVAAMWVQAGAALVDTDAIARALTAPRGAAIAAIENEFGTAMIAADGALDRDRMRALVFAEPAAKGRLEALLHPLIGTEARAQAGRAGAAGAGIVVFDVPLLAESSAAGKAGGWRQRVDRVLVVDCPAALQIERVVARNGWASDQVERVIAQQAPRAARLRIADAVIFNAGLTLTELQAQVRSLAAAWAGEPHQGL
jgi:dephospho-CoA kinase